MKKILLVCNAGMSTSMLVQKMKDAATANQEEVEIWAVGNAESKAEVEKADIVCLGPQVRYLEKKMNELVDYKKPVMVIDIQDYGQMNGSKVLQNATHMIDTFEG